VSRRAVEKPFKRASELFRVALVLAPNAMVTLANSAASLTEVGEQEKAVDAAQRALAAVPEESWMLVHEEADAIEEKRDLGFEPQF
jgi:uncharacterized protein HemY